MGVTLALRGKPGKAALAAPSKPQVAKASAGRAALGKRAPARAAQAAHRTMPVQ